MKAFPEPWQLWRYLSNGYNQSSFFEIQDANRKAIAQVEFPGSGLISEADALETAVMLIGDRKFTPWKEPPPRRSRWARFTTPPSASSDGG